MGEKKRKPGPVPMPKADKRKPRWKLWANDEEARRIERSARRDGLQVGEYLRKAALKP